MMYVELNMPPPDVYEQEYVYWPWGRLLKVAANCVAREAPPSGTVLDYMCGTGYLLNQIALRRPDLSLQGCTLEPRSYVEYANLHYPNANVVFKDALAYAPSRPSDVITCTAGIHHLDLKQQPSFVAKVARELSSGALFVVGESLLAEFSNERERRACALELGAAITRYAIERDSPDNVIESAIDVITNDVLQRGEYKSSLSILFDMLDPCFDIEIQRIWPDTDGAAYGDVILMCRRK